MSMTTRPILVAWPPAEAMLQIVDTIGAQLGGSEEGVARGINVSHKYGITSLPETIIACRLTVCTPSNRLGVLYIPRGLCAHVCSS